MKNMKKSIFGFVASFAVALIAASAQAEYLYCMIEDAQNTYNGNAIAFDYATISTDGGLNYLHFYTTGNVDQGDRMASEASTTPGYYSSAGASVDLAYYAKIEATESEYTTFLFQLWANGNSQPVAWQTYDKSAVASNIFGSTSATGGDSPLVVSKVIPEPTSGILLLLGMAGLALRRRRA